MAVGIICCIVICQLVSCADCEKFSNQHVLPRKGAIKIDTIYHEWGERGYTAANKIGVKLLFNKADFPVQPQVGDSLVKYAGEADYALYTGDSVYVQRFDCGEGQGIIISEGLRK